MLAGGDAADIFMFRKGDTDKTRTSADTTHGKNQDFDFIGGKDFHRHAGELRFETKGGDTWVMGDTNGDGKADFMIHLDGIVKLKEDSFDL